MIRLIALPYSTLLLGTGQQHKVILSPLAEGVTNLVASVIGAYYLGAIGVAIGTLIGSMVSVAFHFLYNMPRTSAIAIDRPLLVKEGCVRPLLCAIPLWLVFLVHFAVPQLSVAVLVSLGAAGLLGSLYLLWSYGLLMAERNRLQSVLRVA
jgi:O-antigen/teichoic acid export membrane protein